MNDLRACAKAALPFYDSAKITVGGNPVVLEAVTAFLNAAAPEVVLALVADAAHAWERVERGDARCRTYEDDLEEKAGEAKRLREGLESLLADYGTKLRTTGGPIPSAYLKAQAALVRPMRMVP